MLFELSILCLVLLVFYMWMNYHFTKRLARETAMFKHMLDQVSGNLANRLVPIDGVEMTPKQKAEQEAVQKGLDRLRQTFPNGIPEEITALIICLMQFAYNAGGPALFFKRTIWYLAVDKDVWYDRVVSAIAKAIGNRKKFDEAVIDAMEKGIELGRKIE